MSARCPTIPLLLQSSIYCAILEQKYMNHCWWSRWWWLFRAIRPFIIALNYIRCFSNKHALLRDSQTKSVCSFAAVLRFHFYYFQTCESQIDTEKHLRTLTPQSTRTITRWKAHNNMLWSQSYSRKSQDILYSLQFHPLCRDHSHHIVIIQ